MSVELHRMKSAMLISWQTWALEPQQFSPLPTLPALPFQSAAVSQAEEILNLILVRSAPNARRRRT